MTKQRRPTSTRRSVAGFGTRNQAHCTNSHRINYNYNTRLVSQSNALKRVVFSYKNPDPAWSSHHPSSKTVPFPPLPAAASSKRNGDSAAGPRAMGGAAARAAARRCLPCHPPEPGGRGGTGVGAGLHCQPPAQDGVPFPATNELDQRYASYFS